jgi:hypothetical protein
MTINTDVLRAQTYLQDNIIALAQQKTAKIAPILMQKTVSGKATFFNRGASRSMAAVVDVHGDSPINAQEFSRRMLTTQSFNDGDMVDKKEINDLMMDPRPFITQQLNAAFQRKCDEVAYDALIGNAYSGEAGATAVTLASFDSGSHVIAAGGTGLTLTKVQNSLKLLRKAKVNLDAEQAYLIVDSEGMDDLLGEEKFTSTRYNNGMGVQSGVVGEILGFQVIHAHILDDYGSAGDYRALVLVPSAGVFATARGLELNMAERADKQFNYYVYVEAEIGATRLEEEKVIDIRLA